jgi:hypothetical protein
VLQLLRFLAIIRPCRRLSTARTVADARGLKSTTRQTRCPNSVAADRRDPVPLVGSRPPPLHGTSRLQAAASRHTRERPAYWDERCSSRKAEVRAALAVPACIAAHHRPTSDAVARSWNLFFIARRRGDEDQLTEMLVWLASAVPAVRSALVELGLGVRVDPSDVTPSTQYGISGGRLDALLEGEGFRLAVESKLGSDYGPDQIGKYLRWLAVRKSSVANSGLMTLTARPTPWSQEEVEYAQREELVASRRLWEDLHEILEPLIDDDDQESLPARMVQEFLEMLADENLVPTRPLAMPISASVGPIAGAWCVVTGVLPRLHGGDSRSSRRWSCPVLEDT